MSRPIHFPSHHPRSASWPLQQVLFSALSSSPHLAGVPIYDVVPEGASPPYVEIGEDHARDDRCKGLHREELEFDVTVYSIQRGRREARQLGDQVIRALTEASLSSTEHGFHLWELRLMDRVVPPTPDGHIQRQILTWRANVDQNQ